MPNTELVTENLNHQIELDSADLKSNPLYQIYQNDGYLLLEPMATEGPTDIELKGAVGFQPDMARDMQTGEGSLQAGKLCYLALPPQEEADVPDQADGFDEFLRHHLGEGNFEEVDDRYSKLLKLMQREFPDHPLLVTISYYQYTRTHVNNFISTPVTALTGGQYISSAIKGKSDSQARIGKVTLPNGAKYTLLFVTCHNFGFKDQTAAFLQDKEPQREFIKLLPGELTCQFVLSPFSWKKIGSYVNHPLLYEIAAASEEMAEEEKKALLKALYETWQSVQTEEAASVKAEMLPVEDTVSLKGKEKLEEAASDALANKLKTALSPEENHLLEVISLLEQALIAEKEYRFANQYAYRRFLESLRNHRAVLMSTEGAIGQLIAGITSLTHLIENPATPIQNLDKLPESVKPVTLLFNLLSEAIVLAERPQQAEREAVLQQITLVNSEAPPHIDMLRELLVALDANHRGEAVDKSKQTLFNMLDRLSLENFAGLADVVAAYLPHAGLGIAPEESSFRRARGKFLYAVKKNQPPLIKSAANQVEKIALHAFYAPHSSGQDKHHLIQLMEAFALAVVSPFKEEKEDKTGKKSTRLEKCQALLPGLPGAPQLKLQLTGATLALLGIVAAVACTALILAAVVASSGTAAIAIPLLAQAALWVAAAIKLTAASAMLVGSAATGAGAVALGGSVLNLYASRKCLGVSREATAFTQTLAKLKAPEKKVAAANPHPAAGVKKP